MSEKSYTIKELKIMNSGMNYNNRILLPNYPVPDNSRWKLQFTWVNSGSLDGKYYRAIPYYKKTNI